MKAWEKVEGLLQRYGCSMALCSIGIPPEAEDSVVLDLHARVAELEKQNKQQLDKIKQLEASIKEWMRKADDHRVQRDKAVTALKQHCPHGLKSL